MPLSAHIARSQSKKCSKLKGGWVGVRAIQAVDDDNWGYPSVRVTLAAL